MQATGCVVYLLILDFGVTYERKEKE
jgi:hypothetical protein